MKQLTGLLLVFLIGMAAPAAEINFVSNLSWQQIKEKAAKENKMIFLDAYTAWCSPCKYLEKNVYTDPNVAAFYNANYINVKVDMEKEEGKRLGKEFGITSHPTLLFFSAEAILVHKNIGAMEAAEFINLGKEAASPEKQYVTLKEKAKLFLLKDAEFTRWAFMAEKLADPDKEKIITSYLASKADILGNKEIALTALLQAENLTEAQLTYLYRQQGRIGELLNWKADRTAAILYKRLFSKASLAYEVTGRNIDSFITLIQKFAPGKETYAEKDLLFKTALCVDKDIDRATKLLIEYFTDTDNLSSKEHTTGWLLNYAPLFQPANLQQINALLSSYTTGGVTEKEDQYCFT